MLFSVRSTLGWLNQSAETSQSHAAMSYVWFSLRQNSDLTCEKTMLLAGNRMGSEVSSTKKFKEMFFMLHCFECDGMGHEVSGTKKGFSCCLGVYSVSERGSGFPPFALTIEI